MDFIGAKDDAGGGDSWSCKMRKAAVKSSPPTNQHPVSFTGQMLFLSPNQQCQTTEEKVIITLAARGLIMSSNGVNFNEGRNFSLSQLSVTNYLDEIECYPLSL